jgi:adenylate cyclase
MIVAFWNAPISQHGHAVSACLAALEQVSALTPLQRAFEQRGWAPVNFRVGISTGPAVVGNMGSERRFAYTAIGDTVNLASRLEGVNKMFGTRILISESTYAAARHEIEARELDWLRVKGKQQPIRVYELVARKNAISVEKRQAFETFDEGLKLYRDKRFKEALARFKAAQALFPDDKAAQTYFNRCEGFLANPPPRDWDGVFVMTEK